jgi:PPOX class probable F420-dependent enzyme
MIPESQRGLLESTALAHVVPIGSHGEPQSNAVWFDWDGEHVRFSQAKTRQKYPNAHRDLLTALSVVDSESPFRYLEILGVVERMEEDPDFACINSMAKKYLGVDKYQDHRPGDERVVVLVRPQRTTSMDG